MKTLALFLLVGLSALTAAHGQAISADQVSGLSTALSGKAPINNPSFTGLVNLPKITGYGTGPTVAAGTGAGSGTGLNVTITGTDLAGYVTVATGASALSAAANATVITITFGTAAGGPPTYVEIHPANAAAASLYGPSAPFAPVPTSGAGITISSNATALGTAVTYRWYYHVIW